MGAVPYPYYTNSMRRSRPMARAALAGLRGPRREDQLRVSLRYSSGTYPYMAHKDLTTRSRVEAKGKVLIPASFRSALGLKVGGEIELRLEDNEIRISTLQSRLARSQARLRTFVKPGRLLSDELVAERRRAVLLA
jgi:antitoxin PrlF